MNEWIDQTPILKAKKKDLYDVRKKHNVKPADAVMYWKRADVQQEYVGYAVLYRTLPCLIA
jgi:hypothetical protein